MAGNSVTLQRPRSKGAAPASQPMRAPRQRVQRYSRALGQLWRYLQSWIGPDGGLHGPVIHRCDLKRTFAVHDTPWTQGPVIRALLELHRSSRNDYWLRWAMKLADAQVNRLEPDGSFRWAGHEDDRFSSLVHNALADRALIDLAATLIDAGRDPEARGYLDAAGTNLTQYLLGKLWDDRLGGMRMNPHGRNLPGAGRFVVNMNSVAVDAMLAWDRCARTSHFEQVARQIGNKLLRLQVRQGPWRGAFAYSHKQKDCHIALYTGLALTSLTSLHKLTGDERYISAARDAMDHLAAMRDGETGLWYHMARGDKLRRKPIFAAGAGMIANGLLDVESLAGRDFDAEGTAEAILRHQHPHGGIANFLGYDDPDNQRPGGTGRPCWEDVLPTPNWNAQSFHFLSRITQAPEPNALPAGGSAGGACRGYIWFESSRGLAVVGLAPLRSVFAGLYVKRMRLGVSLSLLRFVGGFKKPFRRLKSFLGRIFA